MNEDEIEPSGAGKVQKAVQAADKKVQAFSHNAAWPVQNVVESRGREEWPHSISNPVFTQQREVLFHPQSITSSPGRVWHDEKNVHPALLRRSLPTMVNNWKFCCIAPAL
jgi:hypothetical protein